MTNPSGLWALCFILTLATVSSSAALAEDEGVYKWVDERGQIHITTTPPPKNAGKMPERAAEERWVFEWRAPDGSFFVTTTPPPSEAKLAERVQDPRPAGRSGVDGAPAALVLSPLRAPNGVGQRAPTLEYLNALGDDVALADLRGQVVWLVFASRHSAASAAQAKVMAELGESLGPTVTTLFVVGASADVKVARQFAQDHGLPLESALAATPDAFPQGTVPHNVFVDRSGRIAKVHPGRLGAAEVTAAIEALR